MEGKATSLEEVFLRSLDLGGMERGLWCVGSNVESVKRRRVVKRRRKHIEIVDWALERRALLELELILFKECGEGEEDTRLGLVLLVAMVGVVLLFSSGKKTRRKPITLLWVLVLVSV